MSQHRSVKLGCGRDADRRPRVVARRRGVGGTSNDVPASLHKEEGYEGRLVASRHPTALALYTSGTRYTAACHHVKLIIWIARCCRPFAIVTDPKLLNIFTDLHGPCKTPSALTISCDIKDAHQFTKLAFIKKLREVEGVIHVSADGWTSPNTIAFIGVIIQYIERGLIQSLTLDFIKLTAAHTGQYLATQLAECLQEFGIEDRILGFTGDNASNNDTLVEELSMLIPSFRGDAARIRCLAHVINLVARDVLSPFAQKFMADNKEAERLVTAMNDAALEEDFGDVPDDDGLAPELVKRDGQVVEEVEGEANLKGCLSPLTSKDVSAAQVTLTKLWKLAYKIANSPALSEALRDACKRVGIKPQRIKKDVSTRWNSTAELSQSGTYLRPALNRLTLMAEHNKSGGALLRCFHMDTQEWTVMEQLSPLLNVLAYATKEVSWSAVPLVHEVIPIINSITSFFNKAIDDPALHHAVRHAALRGLHMLNKYYSHTNESIVYWIAMILHPEYKLQYFTDAGWAPEWITEACKLVTTEWTTHYKPAVLVNLREESVDVDESSKSAKVDMSVITYWENARHSGHPLARMALDFLSVPPTSTNVERAFSHGGLTISKLHHSMNDESTCSASVFGAWAEVPHLIPFDDLVTHFDDKKSCDPHQKKKKRCIEPAASEIIEVDT
ncbi:hypothetical protein NMY22_g17960 [Coprinellus aureogranulatus]|nr:hypothetical protein NMY22_g17960 [Coprinellus aureogranulatus]